MSSLLVKEECFFNVRLSKSGKFIINQIVENKFLNDSNKKFYFEIQFIQVTNNSISRQITNCLTSLQIDK